MNKKLINNIESTGLKIDILEKKMFILDQRELPFKESWVQVRSTDHFIELVQSLAIRGAPLIGVCASFQLALASYQKNMSINELYQDAIKIKNARPTAVNLQWAIDRMLKENPDLSSDKLINTALNIYQEDKVMCEELGNLGNTLIKDGDNILTICNSGALATAGIGTALGVIINAHESGKKIHVYVPETRPLLQGARLTAWELQKKNIPFTLICDSMAASLMQKEKIDKCFVGADRIAINGDCANKIGTYSLAILCSFHKIPFYVVGPNSTVDFECKNGKDIPIEQRDKSEILGFKNSMGELFWAQDKTLVYNPSFDVTPNHLITKIILNTGIFDSNKLTGKLSYGNNQK